MKRSQPVRIVQFGLGPIGLAALQLAATKPWARIVGAVDIDPAKIGRDLGELSGVAAWRGIQVVPTWDDLPARARPEVVLHTTVSRFAEAFAQLEPLARRGLHVVSTCEEMIFPALRAPALARRLDSLCRRHGARMVAAGVNPGFVMDVLPLCLTGVCRSVQSIMVERVVNASTRREPLQRKIGSGLPPAEFERRFRAGRAGHAGLKESLALIAHAMRWDIGRISETCRAVVAERPIRTQFLEVAPGQTYGLHQCAKARTRAGQRLVLELQMYLDAPEPRDRVRLEGDPPLEVTVTGGVAGDAATVAALVNTVPRLWRAPAGLLLPTDLPVPTLA